MLNEGSGISDDTWSGTADVWIDFEYFFNAFGYNESGIESSLNCKDDSFRDFETDSRWAELSIINDTLMASMAYSTWKILPSGEKVLMPRS
jgi:hypothetical protein